MDDNKSFDGGHILKQVLEFAKKMQWIEREDSFLLKLYRDELNKEIGRLSITEESKKTKRRSRRSVCVRQISPSSSEDDDDDDDDVKAREETRDTGEDNVEENSDNEDDIETGNTDVSKCSDESEDDDDFNAFVTKVKAKQNIIISSDEEDGSDDMDDFIDDSEVDVHTKSTWQKPRKTQEIIFSSDEDERSDQSDQGRPKNSPAFKTPLTSVQRRVYTTPLTSVNFTPYKTPQSSKSYTVYRTPATSKAYTPSILNSVTVPKTPSGSAAYKREYKKLRDQTANDLFVLFNESVFDNQLPKDLKIVFNNRMTKTAGFCYYYCNLATKVRSSKVEIAEKICDSVERLRDTVIHELCHAAAWIINGVKCGHGTYWKYWASKAHKAHPDLPPISRCHQFDIECRYNFKCINPFCGKSYGRHSKSLKKCPDCLGSLQLLGKDGVTPLKQREPNKFALYVKEEYQSTKLENPGMSHSDVMKLLGQNFSKLTT